jgi:hypothetical protein
MFDKPKQILMGIVIFCVFISFNNCKLMKSPISIVKNQSLFWLTVIPGKWYTDNYFSNPTWERLIEEYRYFAVYDSSNWSETKLDKQGYIHLVNYSTKFNNKVTDRSLGAFIINNKTNVPVKDALLYFKKGIMLSESEEREYSLLIYSPQDKARVLEVITFLESGDVTDISFSNGRAVLRWVTNKMADDELEVTFIGTFIIADVKLRKKDGTENTFESFAFYTTPNEPIAPYQYDEPFYQYR